VVRLPAAGPRASIDVLRKREPPHRGTGEPWIEGREGRHAPALGLRDGRARDLEMSFAFNLLPSGLYRRPRSFTGSWGLQAARSTTARRLTSQALRRSEALPATPRGLYRRSGIRKPCVAVSLTLPRRLISFRLGKCNAKSLRASSRSAANAAEHGEWRAATRACA
jgi:hypothetical protein